MIISNVLNLTVSECFQCTIHKEIKYFYDFVGSVNLIIIHRYK